MSRPFGSAQAHSPGGPHMVAGLESVNLVSVLESVRWAGHRFRAQSSAGPVGSEGVTGENLYQWVAGVDPQFYG